jgi:hypothetical protein
MNRVRPVSMFLGKTLIHLSIRSYDRNELRIVSDNLPWDPEDETVCWDNHLFGDQSARPNNGTGLNLCAIQNRGMNPDETIISNRSPMNHCGMPNRDVSPDADLIVFISVDHAAILNVGTVPDYNSVFVPADHRIGEDTTVFSNGHITNDASVWRYET